MEVCPLNYLVPTRGAWPVANRFITFDNFCRDLAAVYKDPQVVTTGPVIIYKASDISGYIARDDKTECHKYSLTESATLLCETTLLGERDGHQRAVVIDRNDCGPEHTTIVVMWLPYQIIDATLPPVNVRIRKHDLGPSSWEVSIHNSATRKPITRLRFPVSLDLPITWRTT